MTDPAEALRERFEVPEGIYLLSHSVGCLPRAARQEAIRLLDLWARDGGGAWPAWLQAIDAFRAAIAALLHATPDQVCPEANVSSAATKLLGAMPARKGRRKLLLTELDFPSIGFVLAQAARERYELVFMRPREDGFPIDLWEEHLTEDVELALITHATYEYSFRSPVAAITALARERGVRTIVDVAQTAGVVDIDVSAWQADVVVGSCIKWLCGGPGAGFLWIDPGIVRDLTPVDVGWFSHADPMQFDIHHFEYAPDARRFWGGTPSVFPFGVAAASARVLLEIGLPRVEQHNRRLCRRLIDGARRAGLGVGCPEDDDKRGGTVSIGCEDPGALVKRLGALGVAADTRPRCGLRLSPHIYNTDQEIDRVLECLSKER